MKTIYCLYYENDFSLVGVFLESHQKGDKHTERKRREKRIAKEQQPFKSVYCYIIL